MAEHHDLIAAAADLTPSQHTVTQLRTAAELADVAGDADAGFHARMTLIQHNYHADGVIDALEAFAWCKARYAADPERFATHQHDLGWVYKWMPGWAGQFSSVPRPRLESLIDELEEHHVSAGAGRRQATAERLRYRRDTGNGDPIDVLLARWRADARTSLSDCPACELRLEAECLAGMGAWTEALALVEPFLAGEVAVCADGTGPIDTAAVPWLLAAERDEHASVIWRRAYRSARGQLRQLTELGDLAAMLARTGDVAGALTLVQDTLSLVAIGQNELARLQVSASLARALRAVEPEVSVSVSASLPDPVGPVPEGGWRAGALASALAELARSGARRFDARNGTAVVGDQVEEVLAAPDLREVALRQRPQRTALSVADIGEAVLEAPDPVAAEVDEPALEPDDVPADPDELDGWARGEYEAWRGERVVAVCRRIWNDEHEDAARRAVAGIWAHGSVEPLVADLAVLADRHELAPGSEARIRAMAAEAVAGDDPSAARDLVDRALGLSDDPAIPPRTAMAARRMATEVLISVGDLDRAEAVVDGSQDLAVDAVGRLTLVTLRLDLAAARCGADREAVAGDALVEAAMAAVGVAREEVPAPLAFASLARAASVLSANGLSEEGGAAAELVTRGTRGIDAARMLRFDALLTLADCRFATEGPAAAMEPQRQAVDLVRDLGPTPMLGWARRGLAFQLREVGRLDEASVQFAEAAGLLDQVGQAVEAALLRIERGYVELNLDEAPRALEIAEEVSTSVDELPEDVRHDLWVRAQELAAAACDASGSGHEAIERWSALADLLEARDEPSAWATLARARAEARHVGMDQALTTFERAEHDATTEPGAAPMLARILEGKALALGSHERYAEGAVAASEAVEHALRAGSEDHAAFLRMLHADLLLDDGDPTAAERALGAAIAAAEALEVDHLAARGHARMADLLLGLGRDDEAERHTRAAAEHSGVDRA